MTVRRVVAGVLALCAVGIACRSTPDPSASPATSAANEKQPGSGAIITRDELENQGLLGVTAMVAVQQLRPGFLIDRTAGRRTSSQPISVSVNGGQMSPVNELNSIPVSTVGEIQYFTAGEAATRFNNRANGPVILVTLLAR
jgi:hypothetical protein